MRLLKKILKFFIFLFLIIILVYFIFFSRRYPLSVVTHSFTIGDTVGAYHGVAILNNGVDFGNSHGKSYGADSFYYGKKWQCVEFVKRYFHDHRHFDFKDGMGNARDFFDRSLKQGEWNKRRGVYQYINGMNEKPRVDDVLVFDSQFGHVAIVTAVRENELDVAQQNIYMTPFQTFVIKSDKGNYIVGEGRKPMGWLRVEGH